MSKFQIKEGSKGFSFQLVASNGETIGISEQYTSLSGCKNGVESVRKNAAVAKVEDQTVDGFAKESNPKFEVYTDKAGEFRFRLKAGNGEAILASEGYKAKASCKDGIESVRKNAKEAEIVAD